MLVETSPEASVEFVLTVAVNDEILKVFVAMFVVFVLIAVVLLLCRCVV